jgi:hypothetical protein
MLESGSESRKKQLPHPPEAGRPENRKGWETPPPSDQGSATRGGTHSQDSSRKNRAMLKSVAVSQVLSRNPF